MEIERRRDERRRHVSLWLLGAVTAAALTTQGVHAVADITFRFTFGSCTLDTATGMLADDRDPRSATALRLSDDELTTIAGILDQIDFWDYPSTFIGVPPGLSAYSIDAAAISYRLRVQRRAQIHEVAWMDSTRPSTEAADRLRALLARIVASIRNHPGLPPLQRGGDCR